jgi:hypothetical protein
MSLAQNIDLADTAAVTRSPDQLARPEGWRPMAAAFAVFAILIQILLPVAAQAAQRGDTTLVVCAISGSQAVRVDHVPAPHKGFAGLPCPDCLTAAAAVVLTPPPVFAPMPAGFVRVEHVPGPAVRLAFARAPPRPPGQGPPTA